MKYLLTRSCKTNLCTLPYIFHVKQEARSNSCWKHNITEPNLQRVKCLTNQFCRMKLCKNISIHTFFLEVKEQLQINKFLIAKDLHIKMLLQTQEATIQPINFFKSFSAKDLHITVLLQAYQPLAYYFIERLKHKIKNFFY